MTTTKSAVNKSNRVKFIIGGILFVSAVVILVVSVTRSTAEFYVSVNELLESEEGLAGQDLRVLGAVIGDSITYDPEIGWLHFTIAHIPVNEDEIEALGGIDEVLDQAVADPDASRLDVSYQGAPPDMLRDGAQVVITGNLEPGGTFYAQELLLKCPSKYEEALPEGTEE
jgi:cytochrome c-type biogenesis protein CcmE